MPNLVDKDDLLMDNTWAFYDENGNRNEACIAVENAPTVDAIPIEWIKEFANDYCDWSQEQLIGVLLRTCKKKRIPTVEAELVKHGYWEWTDDPRTGDFVCSNCLDHNIVRSRYCPNCGAIMDEVKDAESN